MVDATRQILSWEELEELEDIEGGVEQEDSFESAKEENRAIAGWYNGYNPEMDGRKETENMNRGLYFKVEIMPDDFKEVLERMIDDESLPAKQRLARLVSVKHESGEIVDYYRLNMAKVKFFPLMIGLGRMQDIISGMSFNGPIVKTDLYPAPDKGVYTFDKKVGCLLVVDALHQYGYKDADGLPIPILFQMKSHKGREFYDLLRRHNTLVEWARKKGIRFTNGKRSELVEPYMIGFQFLSDTKIVRGKKTPKKGIKVDANIPAYKDFNEDYIQSMYAGPELHRLMKRMLYIGVMENGKPKLVPEGPVIEYCKERIISSGERLKKYNPNGQKISWGEHPLPAWMLAAYNGQAEGSVQEAEQGFTPALLRKQLEEVLIPHFVGKQDEEAAEVLTGALNTLVNTEEKDMGQVLLNRLRNQVQKYIDQMKKELSEEDSSFIDEEAPF